MKVTGLRQASDDYFKFANWDGRQVSPFLIVRKDEVIAVEYLNDLFIKGKGSDTILHAWPGQYRTDVFTYKLKQFKEWKKAND